MNEIIRDAVDGDVIQLAGAEVEVGDVLMFFGRSYRITRIEPASEKTREAIGDPDARFAYSGPDFSITLESRGRGYRVLPR